MTNSFRKSSDKVPGLELPVGVSLAVLVHVPGVEVRHQQVRTRGASREGPRGEKEFLSEVSIISRVHHRHLVKLQGRC